MVVNQMIPIVSVSAVLSLATYLATPNIAKKLKEMNIVGVDVHKIMKPKVAEMGGVAILPPLLALSTFVYFITLSPMVLLVTLSTALFAAYGIIDDVLRLGKYPKVAISAAIGASLLLLANTPLLLFVPVLVVIVGIGNAFNIFAGFNGLEIGTSTSVAFFFSVLCLMTGNLLPFYLSFGMFLILLSFLLHNKYPAKIFPGNIGTFTIGGFFAGVSLYFGLLHLIIPLLVLHTADMIIKGFSAGFFSSSEKKKTRVNGEGILLPRKDYLSLIRLVLRKKPMNERQLVRFFWAMSIIVGITTVALTGVFL
jgi:UDP-N-acetylglucosamine--dolichyl-phosphate N-acetylglucosaminephosphotransferase